MNTYFRITAYHPGLDISFIIDSVNQYDNIGQLCVEIVKHSRIIEGSNATQFDDGNIPKATVNGGNYILRACIKGRVRKEDDVISINGRHYKPHKGR